MCDPLFENLIVKFQKIGGLTPKCFSSLFFIYFESRYQETQNFMLIPKLFLKMKEKLRTKKMYVVKVQKSGVFLFYYCFQKKVFGN